MQPDQDSSFNPVEEDVMNTNTITTATTTETVSLFERCKLETRNAVPTGDTLTLYTQLVYFPEDSSTEERFQEVGSNQNLGALKAYALFKLHPEDADQLVCTSGRFADDTERFMLAYSAVRGGAQFLPALRFGAARAAMLWFEHGPQLLALRLETPRGEA
jgi:hypothetical protein